MSHGDLIAFRFGLTTTTRVFIFSLRYAALQMLFVVCVCELFLLLLPVVLSVMAEERINNVLIKNGRRAHTQADSQRGTHTHIHR